jgi:hypothetical protein
MSKVRDAAVIIINRCEYVLAVMACVKIITAETRIISAIIFMVHLVELNEWTPLLCLKTAFDYKS